MPHATRSPMTILRSALGLGALLSHGCATYPSAAVAHLAGRGGVHECSVVRRPEAHDAPGPTRAAVDDAEAHRWLAAIEATPWWAERTRREGTLRLDPAHGAQALLGWPTGAVRYRPGVAQFVLSLRWAGATSGPAHRGHAFFLVDSPARDVFRVVAVLWSGTDADQAQLDTIERMVGDDGRIVLFGIEEYPPHASVAVPEGYGWLAWYDGDRLHVEHHTCEYRQPQ